jgi:hypothetical protein
MAPFVFPTTEEMAMCPGSAAGGSASTGRGQPNGSGAKKEKDGFSNQENISSCGQ